MTYYLAIFVPCLFEYFLEFLSQDQWCRIKILNKSHYDMIRRIAQSKKVPLSKALALGLVETVIHGDFDFESIRRNLLRNACKGGNKQLIRKTLGYSEAYNDGLFGACYRGDWDLINWMIELGATDWDKGLAGACEGNKQNVALNMIDRGADNWNYVLDYACMGGNLEMVDFIFNHMDQIGFLDQFGLMAGVLSSACEGGNIIIVKRLIEKGVKDWDIGLYYACRYNQMDIAKLMIEHGAPLSDSALLHAIKNNNPKLVRFLLDTYIKMDQKIAVINDMMNQACRFCDMEIIMMLVNHLRDFTQNTNVDCWNSGLRGANMRDKIDAMELMIKLGATKFDETGK